MPAHAGVCAHVHARAGEVGAAGLICRDLLPAGTQQLHLLFQTNCTRWSNMTNPHQVLSRLAARWVIACSSCPGLASSGGYRCMHALQPVCASRISSLGACGHTDWWGAAFQAGGCVLLQGCVLMCMLRLVRVVLRVLRLLLCVRS